jgi:D-glycero-D-manno-heptose 1,7-bisphosphate phosphatase
MHRAVGLAGGRIDAVFYCPHAQEANCLCRKPRPGLYEEIGRRFNTSLKNIPCIGDAQRDLEAAAAVGGQPMLVLTGKGEKTKREGKLPPGTLVFRNLAEAVKSFLKE